MEAIFHEKQEGSLCAQHCLNALLQGPYFTAVDLAELASQLDELERTELRHESNSHPSHNMNEEGYFSVQVISKALSIWGLELVPFLQQSPEGLSARTHPENEHAFICNFGNHWFTIRRFGSQWFDLNSLSSKPKLISTTYLNIYLAQLQQEGHSIFFITGTLPDCEADQLISLCPVPDHHTAGGPRGSSFRPRIISVDPVDPETTIALAASKEESDLQNTSLQRALEASRLEAQEAELREALRLSTENAVVDTDDETLAQAIALSLQQESDFTNAACASQPTQPSCEELRSKRKAFLDRLEHS